MDDILTMSAIDVRSEAEYHAGDVLDNYWDGCLFPVDPVKIALAMGNEVFSADLGRDAFCMTINKPSGGQIYSSRDQPSVRYRYTVAHALGHLVETFFGAHFLQIATDGCSRSEEHTIVDRRSDVNTGDHREIFANHFAGALLMPADELDLELSVKDGNLISVAKYFGVSLTALQYRRNAIRLLGSRINDKWELTART